MQRKRCLPAAFVRNLLLIVQIVQALYKRGEATAFRILQFKYGIFSSIHRQRTKNREIKQKSVACDFPFCRVVTPEHNLMPLSQSLSFLVRVCLRAKEGSKNQRRDMRFEMLKGSEQRLLKTR